MNKNVFPATAVFLDRDGTINKEIGLLHKIEDFELIRGSAAAIKKLNAAGIRAVVVTNQPVVARGLCSEDKVKKINEKMEELLAEKGARLDAIFFCPHHEEADLGQYRKDCPNRKPNIGFFKQAGKKFGLDLKNCFMVGDQTRDIEAGKRAGCRTILLKTGFAGKDKKFNTKPDFECKDLAEAVDLIVRGMKK